MLVTSFDVWDRLHRLSPGKWIPKLKDIQTKWKNVTHLPGGEKALNKNWFEWTRVPQREFSEDFKEILWICPKNWIKFCSNNWMKISQLFNTEAIILDTETLQSELELEYKSSN